MYFLYSYKYFKALIWFPGALLELCLTLHILTVYNATSNARKPAKSIVNKKNIIWFNPKAIRRFCKSVKFLVIGMLGDRLFGTSPSSGIVYGYSASIIIMKFVKKKKTKWRLVFKYITKLVYYFFFFGWLVKEKEKKMIFATCISESLNMHLIIIYLKHNVFQTTKEKLAWQR